MLQFVGYARMIFPTMIKWYLIIAITPTSSWVGHTMSVTLIEKHQITFQWSNYDLHFIIKALAKSDSEKTFFVIPASEEKNISLTISVYIKRYTDKNGKIKKLNKNLRFIDSYRFMLASLVKLVDNLPNEKFFLLENYFEKLGHSPEKVSV